MRLLRIDRDDREGVWKAEDVPFGEAICCDDCGSEGGPLASRTGSIESNLPVILIFLRLFEMGR
jgi:hypothetical protein